MKKIHTYYYGLVLFIISIACTKEITDDLTQSFSLKFTETTLDSFLNTAKPTEFSIEGVRSTGTGDYQFKYSIQEGAGFFTINSQRIAPNEFVDLPEGALFTIEYTGTAIDINRVDITVKDRFDREDAMALVYDVKDTAFDIEVTPIPTSAYIGGISDLNFKIINQISSADYLISYKFVDSNSNTGTGIIFIGEDVLDQEEFIDIDQGGEFVWQLESTTVGDLAIAFVVRSSLNVTVEKIVTIPVTETPDFTFTAVTTDLELPTNTGASVDFEIVETTGSSEYTMIYTSTGIAVFGYNGEEYQPGDEIPIEIGVSSGTYTGTEMGNHEVDFKVVNSNSTRIEKTSAVTITYTDPDIEAPVIVLNGAPEITIKVGEEFTDPGATATDNIDASTLLEILITGSVDISKPGEYIVTYSVTDSSSNTASITRKVTVIDDQAPILELIGDNPMIVFVGDVYTDPGVNVTDNVDAPSSLIIETTGSVDTNIVNDYTITYVVTDSSDNTASLDRIVKVINDAPPVITLIGPNPLEVNASFQFNDPGATAVDVVDGDLTDAIEVVSTVVGEMPGNYTITYSISDSVGNRAMLVRDVKIIDTEAPVIILNGLSEITLNLGSSYMEKGALVSDNVETIDSDDVVITGAVNTALPGVYIIRYNVVDTAGNPALEVTRKVTVIDHIIPVITINGGANISVDAGDPFVDSGATANDNLDGNITSSIQKGGTFRNTLVPGNYTITYNVRDAAGNAAIQKVKTVVVRSVTPSYNNNLGNRLLRANPGAIVTYSIGGGGPPGAVFDAYVQMRRDEIGGAAITSKIRINQNNPNITGRTFVMPDSGRAFVRTSITGDADASAGGTLSVSGKQFTYTVTRAR
ncbi:DUF5011 domain-containing protein [Aquimarina sp. RZ0]|uniref:DUF5011 domain-containing protein n=1 Tax=Aquimarina sp. RZ0 TaxID=2607730 RepID=UPI0011F34A76|nr:DUF5011 domain-containing protein [Aquimarina sp. RZ0]KAA1246126.1 DUF5011 domain-containing protein [Aquimarina sp. RZ0]